MSLIRREVIFRPSDTIRISYNYNTDVMKSIYYYLSIADKQKEKFLHDVGYKVNNKPGFKLFNFTLLFKNAKFGSNDIEINNNSKVILILSGKDDIINSILKGLLHIKKIKITDKDISLDDIVNVEKVNFKTIALYKALSPVVTTTNHEDGRIMHLRPYVDKYYINLAHNLKKKYSIIYDEEFEGPLYFDIDNVIDMKKKKHRVNNFFKVGFLYNLWIETTPKMHEIIYYLGLGENNSTGAGCMSLIKVGDSDE
ncbi:CRISPR-associated endoribonuclease Cas6 [Tissierella carlieri]|uniref:CRISPR-associated endoribonuclease n=1 Tax=Tissierella carlieri TaxID=689904 RepID=A0ABT1SEX8_9FIRM|nr:CRISPR-associated endoribonuclease Cas6 [Tissierella carlieri]MCQ4925040.1 CRISPR-associated endoribonuclease Cas6 [Tissierella carlieri]